MTIIKTLIVLWLTCIASMAHADSDRTDHYEGIREHRLDNGMQMVLFPLPDADKTYVSVVYGTGSLADPQDREGTAHLLEHLMFQDTRQRSAREIRDGLTKHGIQFAATVSYDRTRYDTVFENSDAALDFALEWEAERMAGLSIQPEGLELERRSVLAELDNIEADPMRAFADRLLEKMSTGQGVGRVAYGIRSTVATLTTEELERFYHAHYHPRNATLVIVGGFEEKMANAAGAPLLRPPLLAPCTGYRQRQPCWRRIHCRRW